jgi:hypothetical protein
VAGAAETGQLEGAGWNLADGLPTWERELFTVALEEVAYFVGTKAERRSGPTEPPEDPPRRADSASSSAARDPATPTPIPPPGA